MPRALTLISGSLDSEVAATLVKQAGCEVACAVFACPFQHRTGVEATAARLDAPLITLQPGADFLDVVRRPRFNFGGGPLSCLECRVRMLTAAKAAAAEHGCDFVVTGDVLGQRATNQSRRQLELAAYHSGLGDALIRPLSAKLLDAESQSEREGVAQRFSGSGRRPIRTLARRLGISDVDRPGPACRLTDPGYAARLDDLLVHHVDVDFADVELLLLGRHYRVARHVKAVVGRNAADNEAIAAWSAAHSRGRLFVPANFQGPSVLLLQHGPTADPNGDENKVVEIALSLAASRKPMTPEDGFQFREGEQVVTLPALQPVEAFKPIQAGAAE